MGLHIGYILRSNIAKVGLISEALLTSFPVLSGDVLGGVNFNILLIIT